VGLCTAYGRGNPATGRSRSPDYARVSGLRTQPQGGFNNSGIVAALRKTEVCFFREKFWKYDKSVLLVSYTHKR
jgi:hypothetical protein